MNTTHHPPDEMNNDPYFSQKLGLIQGSIYIPIFCAGIANNFLTVLIILLNRDMRTVTNFYLLNLAISDTLPLIVSLPFEISFFPIVVPWGTLGCRLRAVLAETSTNASILTISAFTIERYLAVCQPSLMSSFSTTRRAYTMQVIIWIIAIVSTAPYFYLMKNEGGQCLFDDDFPQLATVSFRLSAALFFVLPAFILCCLYALMARRLYAAGLMHEVHCSKGEGTDSTGLPLDLLPDAEFADPRPARQYRLPRRLTSPSLTLAQQSIVRHRHMSSSGVSLHIQAMKKSAFKMLFAVVIAFIICYAPFHVQRLITSRLNAPQLTLTQRRAIVIFYFISGILYYLGSTVNPIIYHLFSRKYRLACMRTMKRLVHCQSKARHRNYLPKSNARHDNRPMPYAVHIQRLPSRKGSIYRATAKTNAPVDRNSKKDRRPRSSLPTIAHQRIR